MIRTLTESLISPATFDFWASHIDRTWSWQRPLARIVARTCSAQDCITLTLKPNRHVAPFRAGQHLNVTLAVRGIRLTRSYSPSQVPGQPDLLTITIKRMAEGKVSHWLYDHAQVGDVLELGAPFGEMVLAEQQQDYLFLAAGSGITPFISLIREWTRLGPHVQGRVTLLYWAKTAAELCFTDELRALAAKHPQLNVHLILTQEASDTTPAQGRINAEMLTRLVPDLTARTVYACGPADFVRTAKQLTADTAQGFHGEAFSQPILISSETTTDAPQVEIQLTRSKRTVSVPAGQPLLAALEAQGIYPASGCRMGICNTCSCTKQSGTTLHILDRDLNTEAGANIRICVSSAQSDLTLDL